MMKLIVVTGGVLSGLGKGHVAASIARLLMWRGLRVSLVKIDPYLNVDAGTMSPFEHGEVFVTEDVWEFEPAPGFKFRIAETDQDLGTYERFTGLNMHPSNNITSGQVYLAVVLRERAGFYLGRTVQLIPHVTDEIKRRIRAVWEREKPDVLIVEIGGTVGDYEAAIFLEALRQLRNEIGPENFALVHVTYVPYLSQTGELKTKPTQHSVQRLLEHGLMPDVIVCRCVRELDTKTKQKIALFCNVRPEAVISDPDLDCVYELPLVFERQGLGELLIRRLGLSPRCDPSDGVSEWEELIQRFRRAGPRVRIAMVGKYVAHRDAYISIREALLHAGAYLGVRAEPVHVDAERLNESSLSSYDGILLTPGFGARAVEGMIEAAKVALEDKIPFLGVCFGCQLAVVAFARRVMGWQDAHTTEVDPRTPYPVVDLLPEQRRVEGKGGTMRLGALEVIIEPNTRLFEAYRTRVVRERFRHRYHIVEKFARRMCERGLVISARTRDSRIAAVEVKWHPWFVGVQFHPEFKSRPFAPHPLYVSFVRACTMMK